VKVEGRWRIVEMELWDRNAIDLLGRAFVDIRSVGTGIFRFIAVEGWMDIRQVERSGLPGIEFSWDGNDEGDAASGRGWAWLSEGGELRGRIFFHLGDDSSFRAVRDGSG
jgi:hypothetical protein